MGDTAAPSAEIRPRPLLFYSYWSLDYYNPEAKLKAEALVDAGYDVVYVAGIGMRNPRPSSFGKLVDRTVRKLARVAPAPQAEARVSSLRTAAVAVAPPRQLGPVRRANEAWMSHQLGGIADPWSEAIAWVRWPTPELVGALVKHRPAAVIYECVDPYDVGPGVNGRWTEIFRSAESALVETADLVVVPTPSLGERFAGRAEVRVVPHGVDLRLFRRWDCAPLAERPTVGFAGTLDYRLDTQILEALADDGRWKLSLIGPLGPGFEVDTFATHPNVTVHPAVPHEQIGEAISTFDIGVLPYHDRAPGFDYEYTDPLKALELLAAGKPVVAKPNTSLKRLGPVVTFAGSPAEFVAEVEAEIAGNSTDGANSRRRVAEANSWAQRFTQIRTFVEALGGPVMDRPAAGDHSTR
jgi:glycosyltransferase involved in cell wall biosynthesis